MLGLYVAPGAEVPLLHTLFDSGFGRAGRQGLAISIASARDQSKLKAIEAPTRSSVKVLEQWAANSPTMELLAEGLAGDSNMDTILISGGRKDKVRPGDIRGALIGEAGALSGKEIGKIEIHDRVFYVAVEKK